MSSRAYAAAALCALPFLLSGCPSQTTMGTQQGPVTGSVGPTGVANVSDKLERCTGPLGTIALVEPQDPVFIQQLAGFGLSSPVPVLRLLMQQSNCFMVVDRGQAMQIVQQERALAGAGQMQGGARMGGGQIVAADLALTPNVVFSGNTGGMGGALGLLGAFIPGYGGLIASTIGASVNIKFTSAQSVLTLTDVRSGVQVSAAQGTATSEDIGIGASLFGVGSGGGAGGSFGGYANTPEGRVVAAALMDAYNNVVRTVRSMPPLPSMASLGGSGAAPPRANSQSAPRLAVTGNYVLRSGPGNQHQMIGRLGPGTEVEATGREQGDWFEIRSGELQGWISKRGLRPM